MGTYGRYVLPSILVAFMIVLPGCEGSSTSAGAAVDPFGWEAQDAKAVVFRNTDTVAVRDIAVFFAYSAPMLRTDTITIELEIVTPDSVSFAERIPVAFPMWPEAQVARVCVRPYRSGVVLGEEGEYGFYLRHTGTEPVTGIRAVGIEITETEDGER